MKNPLLHYYDPRLDYVVPGKDEPIVPNPEREFQILVENAIRSGDMDAAQSDADYWNAINSARDAQGEGDLEAYRELRDSTLDSDLIRGAR